MKLRSSNVIEKRSHNSNFTFVSKLFVTDKHVTFNMFSISGVWLIFGNCRNGGSIVPDFWPVGSLNITGNGWNVFANHCPQWQDLRPVWTEVVLRSWRCKYGNDRISRVYRFIYGFLLPMLYFKYDIYCCCIYVWYLLYIIYCCIHTDSSRVLQLCSGSTTTPCHQLGECGLGGSGFVSQLSIFLV